MTRVSQIEQARMSIGVVERMTGINANTLRMWERRYQLGPSKRSPGGQREYSSTDIDHLRLIKKLIDNGMRIGDVAQLSITSLTNLLLECGGDSEVETDSSVPLSTKVIGAGLGVYFTNHIKRYPKLAISCTERDTDEWLSDVDTVMSDLTGIGLLILQQSALNRKHLDVLANISAKKVHVVILYLYSHNEVLNELDRLGIQCIQGNIEPERIDTAVNRVLKLTSNLSVLKKNGKEFDISIPNTHPRQFDSATLLEAEAMSNKLNCECPAHLSDLVRRLNAFEDYSHQAVLDE